MSSIRLIRGQSVVLPGGSFGTVIDHPNEERVRISWPTGGTSVYYTDEVKTRADYLHHAWHTIRRLAAGIGDVELMDVVEQGCVFVDRAAEQCDAADAVKGLAS